MRSMHLQHAGLHRQRILDGLPPNCPRRCQRIHKRFQLPRQGKPNLTVWKLLVRLPQKGLKLFGGWLAADVQIADNQRLRNFVEARVCGHCQALIPPLVSAMSFPWALSHMCLLTQILPRHGVLPEVSYVASRLTIGKILHRINLLPDVRGLATWPDWLQMGRGGVIWISQGEVGV